MSNQYFLTVCLNPTIQKTLVFDECQINEVNRAKESYIDVSGKGVNVTRVLQQMGATAVHLTHNSNHDSEQFLKICKKDGLQVKVIPAPMRVRTCTTLISNADDTITELVEAGDPISKKTEKKIRSQFNKLIRQTHTLIISGTTSPGYSKEIYADMTRLAKINQVQVILDIRGEPLLQALKEKPDFIKINVAEFVSTFFPHQKIKESDNPLELLPGIEKKAYEIKAQYGTKIILTMGSRGVISYADKNPIQSPALECRIRNTIGCGDAFTAGFALQQYRNPENLEKAIHNGQKCAAANATLIRPGRILP